MAIVLGISLVLFVLFFIFVKRKFNFLILSTTPFFIIYRFLKKFLKK